MNASYGVVVPYSTSLYAPGWQLFWITWGKVASSVLSFIQPNTQNNSVNQHGKTGN